MARKRADRDPMAPATTEQERNRLPQPEDRCACGAPRFASGRCTETDQWPVYVWRLEGRERFTLEMPFTLAVCDVCRGPLDWEGACFQCFGSRTPQDRATWRFPGDRYEREDYKHDGEVLAGVHWVKVDGPRAAAIPDAAAFKAIRAMIARIGVGPLEVPMGTCPQHSDGCGRSGKPWDAVRATGKERC